MITAAPITTTVRRITRQLNERQRRTPSLAGHVAMFDEAGNYDTWRDVSQHIRGTYEFRLRHEPWTQAEVAERVWLADDMRADGAPPLGA